MKQKLRRLRRHPGSPASANGANGRDGDRPAGGGGSLVSARSIELSGQWGHVFGPLDLNLERGGVSLIQAPPGAARTALLMSLCGRMRLRRGHLTVLGTTNDQQKIFQQSSIACFDELDEPKPSVTVQDLVTDQRRWESNFFKWVPLATTEDFKEMCGYLFEGLPTPPIDAFIADLPELEQMLIRIGVANTRRKPLLVVGRLDQISDHEQRDELLDRLLRLGEKQSVIAAHANASEYRERVRDVVEVPGLFEFQQRQRAAVDIAHEEQSGKGSTEKQADDDSAGSGDADRDLSESETRVIDRGDTGEKSSR